MLLIRKASSADLPAVSAIEREQFSNPWLEDSFQVELANSFSSFYVAEEKENAAVVGFLIFWRLGKELELHKIAVRKTCQRRGYGSRLLAFFKETARVGHAERAWLEVRASNTAAIHLYEKFAFKCVGRRRNYYRRPEEDALVYELVL